jgi:DNA-binding HxlR family transcriptional regulator
MDRECQQREPVCQRYQRAAEIVGRRWSAAVIRVAFDGPVRFTEIRSAVEGLSARLLTERLRELEEEGIIERDPAAGATGAYRLTAKGRALWQVVRELEAWAQTWASQDAAEAPGGSEPQQRRTPAPRE